MRGRAAPPPHPRIFRKPPPPEFCFLFWGGLEDVQVTYVGFSLGAIRRLKVYRNEFALGQNAFAVSLKLCSDILRQSDNNQTSRIWRQNNSMLFVFGYYLVFVASLTCTWRVAISVSAGGSKALSFLNKQLWMNAKTFFAKTVSHRSIVRSSLT